MKNRKLQRVLTWILTLTMILGTFGETGFAVKAAEPDEEAEVSVEPDPDESKSDIMVNLDLKTAYDGSSADATGRIQYAKVNVGDATVVIPATTSGNTRATVATDSENDYKVYLTITKGYTFDDTAIESIKYKDYSEKTHEKIGEVSEKTVDATEYSVEKIGDTLILVTLPSTLLKKVVTASYCKDYDATDSDKDDYFVDPEVTVLAKNAKGLKTRVMDKPSVVNATCLDDIAPTTRTASWCNTGTTSWDYDLTGFITDKALTANMIKVTYTEVGQDPVTVTPAEANEIVSFTNTSNHPTLSFAAAYINKYVYNEAEITIAIDGSANDTNKKTITAVSDSTFATLVKHDSTTAINGSEFTIADTNIDVDVKMNGGNGTRKVKDIVVTENNDGTKWVLSQGADIYTTTTADKCYKVAVNGKIDDDITIAVTTNEVVTFNGHTAASIFDEKGNPLTVAESGKALTFEVRPDTGKELTKLVYSVGNASDNVELTKTSDNFYTIPEGVIVDQLFIEATIDTTADQRKVTPVLDATGADLSGLHLAGVYAGEVSGTREKAFGRSGDGVPYTWSISNEAVAGKYFYFTVEPEDATYTTFAQYRFATTGEWVDAEFIKTTELTSAAATAYVYRTAIIPGTTLQIKAWGVKGAKVLKPANTRVDVSFVDGQIVDASEDFYFTVTPKASDNSTITIDRVQWTNTGVAPTSDSIQVLTAVNGKYCLDKSVLSENDTSDTPNRTSGMDGNGVQIYVYTTENMNTEAYTATFALANEGPAYKNPRLVNTKDADGKITAQKLNLVYGSKTSDAVDSGALDCTFKTTTRVVSTIGSVGDVIVNTPGVKGFRAASYSDDQNDKTKNIVKLESGVVVAANRVGTDTIIATYTDTTTDVYNKVVWTADLDVEVTAAYEDLTLYAYDKNNNEVSAVLADADGGDTSNSNKVVKLIVKGTDVRTGEVVTVPSDADGVVRIDWSLDPDEKAMDPSSMNYKLAKARGTSIEGNTVPYTNATTDCAAYLYDEDVAYVRAKAADPATIKVLATCTVAGEEKPVVLEKELTIVDEAHFAAFATLQVSGAAEDKRGWNSSEVTTIPAQSLELAANGRNTLSVQYDVYKRVSDAKAVEPNYLTTAVELGEYAKVGAADGITWEAVVKNASDADKTEYVKVSGGADGAFTITANAKTAATADHTTGAPEVTIRAYKAGVIVAESSFKVTVANTFAKGTVRLLLDDEATYTVSGTTTKPVQQALTSATYTGKQTSIVEPNTIVPYAALVADGTKANAGSDIVSVRGIEFVAETVGSIFTLPTQADFDQTKIGANQLLLGWVKATVTTTENQGEYTISVTDSSSNEDYFYPGEEVTVVDGNIYRAVWAPKYAFATPIVDAGDNKGLGSRVYNQNLETKDPADGSITGYQDPFAAVDYDSATTDLYTYPITGQIAQGGEIPLVLSMVEAIPYNAENKAKVLSAEKNLNQVVYAQKYIYSNDLTVEVTGANASMLTPNKGVLKASATAALVSSDLNITVKWAEGNKTYSTVALPMEIVEDMHYTLSINGGQDKTFIEDQKNNNKVNVVLKLGEEAQAASTADQYTWTWKSSDETVATVATGDGSGTTAIITGEITPLKAGTTTLTLEAVDAFGTKAVTTAETDCEVTVTANDVVFTVKDADGNEVDLSKGEPIWALANKSSAADTGFTLTAEPAITINSIEGDGKIVASTGNSIDAGSRKVALETTVADLSDEGWILINYTKSGDHSGTTYAKKINVSTYYTFTLNPVANSFITKDGTELKAANGNAIPATIRVTTANLQKLTNGNIVYTNFDLTGYAAVFKGAVPKDFVGWDKDAETEHQGDYKVDYLKDALITDKIAKDGKFSATGALNAGSVALTADFADATITGVTIAQSTVTLTNEQTLTNRPSGLSADKTFALSVEPYNTKAALTLVPDKAQLYASTDNTVGAVDAVKGGVKAKKAIGAGVITLTLADTAVVDNDAKKRTDSFYLKTVAGRAGVVKFDVKSPTGVVLETLTVNIDGYDTVDDAYYEGGVKVVNDSRKVGGVTWFFDEEGKHVTGDKIITKADGTRIAIVAGELAGTGKVHIDGKDYVVGQNGVLITGWITATYTAASGAADGVYYADPDANGALLTSTLKKIGDKTYYFKANQEKAVASATADLYELQGEYYVNAAGEVAINGIFRVKGVNRLFREDGSIVSYTDPDVISGKIKVGGVDYVIDPKDDSAKRDDVLYNAKVNWTVKFPNSFKKGSAAPELEYEVTYTSANTSETKTSDPIKVTATSANNFSAGSTDKEVTFVAVADLTGYFEDKEGTKPAKNVELTKTYKFKEGSDESTGGGSESGQSEGEAESNAINLFYNDEDINIELPEGVDTSVKNGKWASYYSIDESGKVTVTGDRKKAASAANSLIVLPIMGSDDSGNAVQIGEFQYQLPVFYQKPLLKLSSKSGSVNAKLSEDQELYTTVLERKSTGVYEPLDLSEQDEATLWVGKSGTVTAELGENAGEVKLITKAKASGSIAVKLDNWSETVELKYSVKASNKNVLTASAKKVFMNTAATAGEAQTVTIKINGRDITAEDGVKADLSKLTGKNITVEGVAEDGTLEGSEVSFAYQETAPVKGNYNVTFKTSDGTKVKVTVSVSNAALDSKAVSIKLQTKMDLVSGQKMVLVPTLKAIGGEISEVKLDEAGAALFDCEYNEELNQIYLTAVDASKLNAKEKYSFNVILTVGGVDCTVQMKNVKLTAKKPAVKISKVVVSKSKVVAGTAEAEANVLSTVKQGGKTFTVAPTSVEFNGTKNDDGTWTISDSKKGTATVSYDAETGTIKVVSAANAAGKMPAIKAVIKYNAGVEVKKTISVKVDSKK